MQRDWSAALVPNTDTLVVDDAGVRRTRADGGVESVRWTDLREVVVVTTDEGPLSDDIFVLLMGPDKTGCAVPSETDGFKLLLNRLFKLPGFDHEKFGEACRSADNATLPCWKRPA